MRATADDQPVDRVSFTAADRERDRDRDRDAGWLDAAAGCEYVDDRIRLE